jgi:hypothetical protein
MSLDNANPTILSSSELPTHRQRRKARDESSKEHGLREVLMGKSSYTMDPFYMSDFSDSDSDDSNVEPIDEQEIYGSYLTVLNLVSSKSLSITSIMSSNASWDLSRSGWL